MPEYKVYTLTDPRNNTVFYVGMTKNPEERLKSHIKGHGSPPQERDAAIVSILKDGYKPVLDVIDTATSEMDALSKERYWINHYLTINPDLTNKSFIRTVPQETRRHKRTEGDIVEVPDGYIVATINGRHYPMKTWIEQGRVMAIGYSYENGEPVSYASKYQAKHFAIRRYSEEAGTLPKDPRIQLAIGA